MRNLKTKIAEWSKKVVMFLGDDPVERVNVTPVASWSYSITRSADVILLCIGDRYETLRTEQFKREEIFPKIINPILCWYNSATDISKLYTITFEGGHTLTFSRKDFVSVQSMTVIDDEFLKDQQVIKYVE